MAVRIKRSDLTEEQAMLIRSHLCLQPQEKNQFLANKYGIPPKPPILFYIFKDPYVYVPFTFGAALLRKPVNQDLEHPKANFTFTGELFEHQLPIVEEAAEHLRMKGTTTIGLYPGFGKTVVGAKLATDLGLYVAVLYHRDFLGGQWETTFRNFTNATTWIVGTSAPKEFPQVTLCMDTKVQLLPDAYRDRIGCLIIDEAHALCTPSRVECLLSWQPRYVIAETATLIRDDGLHLMIQSITGVHGIFKTSTKPFTVYQLETSIEPEVKNNRQGTTDWTSLIKYICYNEDRNRMILSLVKNNPQYKIMILCAEVRHVELLCESLREMGESVDSMAGTKSTYSDSRILVGTISKIGTGFDEKTACPNFNGVRINMLILCTSIKKASLLEQSIGRVFRAEMPVVIDLVDDNPILKRHWKERQKWYISRNGTIKTIKMIPQVNQEQRVQENATKFLQDKLGSLTLKQ